MRAPLALVAALPLAACSYDLDVLRGRDAGVDVRRMDAPVVDMPAPDAPPMDIAPDRAPDLPAVDAPPPRDASAGACMGRTAIPLVAGMGGAVGANGVVTVEGNTTGGEATVPGCEDTAATPMSTRVYRYVVQTGPRLVATTNTGLCGMGTAAAHDTILGAYFTCAAGGLVPGPRSCVDDDRANVCAGMTGCADNNGLGCGTVFSTLELSGLVRGDVVYLAVSSFPAMGAPPRGPFRLSVAENGLSPAAPPTMGTPLVTNRCACPSTTAPLAMWATREIEFPRAGATNQLGTQQRSVYTNLPVGLRQVWGLSGTFRLSSFNVATANPCGVSGGAQATLDITIGTSIVASLSLGVYVGEAGTVTIPFTTFAPVSFNTDAGAGPTFQYRIRNVQPADTSCVAVDIDLNAPNTLTLYGAM